MPFFFSERLPVPSLKSYCTLSLVIFLVSALFARNKLYQQDEVYTNATQFDSLYDVYLNEPFCLWVSLKSKEFLYIRKCRFLNNY